MLITLMADPTAAQIRRRRGYCYRYLQYSDRCRGRDLRILLIAAVHFWQPTRDRISASRLLIQAQVPLENMVTRRTTLGAVGTTSTVDNLEMGHEAQGQVTSMLAEDKVACMSLTLKTNSVVDPFPYRTAEMPTAVDGLALQ